MRVYTGPVAGRQVAQLRRYGMGRFMTPVPGGWKYPLNGIPWALDNGAFGAWTRGDDFPEEAFRDLLDKIGRMVEGMVELRDGTNAYCRRPLLPDFGVIPDVVAGGKASLDYSLGWLDGLPTYFPWYLAVQDGMREEDVQETLELALELWGCIRGIFVGGSLEWKLETAHRWVRFAHERGMRCHIGRVGTFRRLVWAREIGADSVDSTNFAQSATYYVAEEAQKQSSLPGSHASAPLRRARKIARTSARQVALPGAVASHGRLGPKPRRVIGSFPSVEQSTLV